MKSRKQRNDFSLLSLCVSISLSLSLILSHWSILCDTLLLLNRIIDLIHRITVNCKVEPPTFDQSKPTVNIVYPHYNHFEFTPKPYSSVLTISISSALVWTYIWVTWAFFGTKSLTFTSMLVHLFCLCYLFCQFKSETKWHSFS